jgi:hypothetical protein
MHACIQYIYTGMTAQRQRELAKGLARFDTYMYTHIHTYIHSNIHTYNTYNTYTTYIHTYMHAGMTVQHQRG